jgi:hypothetical protein
MDINDFVYYKKDDKCCSLGLNLDSYYLDNNISPLININKTDNKNENENDKVSNIFENMVIPSGIVTQIYKNNVLNNEIPKDKIIESGTIDDDIYNKLLGLVSINSNTNKSKKNTIKNKKNDVSKNSKKNKQTKNKNRSNTKRKLKLK